MEKILSIGDHVLVTPSENDDFSESFIGEILNIEAYSFTVADDDYNCYEVEAHQVEAI